MKYHLYIVRKLVVLISEKNFDEVKKTVTEQIQSQNKETKGKIEYVGSFDSIEEAESRAKEI